MHDPQRYWGPSGHLPSPADVNMNPETRPKGEHLKPEIRVREKLTEPALSRQRATHARTVVLPHTFKWLRRAV